MPGAERRRNAGDECRHQKLTPRVPAEAARRDRRGLEGEGVEACRDDDPLGPAKAVLTLIGEPAWRRREEGKEKDPTTPKRAKEEMEANIKALEAIYAQAKELERKNQLLRAKYENDEKYARLHKRLMEKDPLTDSESKLFEALQGLKREVDLQILQNV